MDGDRADRLIRAGLWMLSGPPRAERKARAAGRERDARVPLPRGTGLGPAAARDGQFAGFRAVFAVDLRIASNSARERTCRSAASGISETARIDGSRAQHPSRAGGALFGQCGGGLTEPFEAVSQHLLHIFPRLVVQRSGERSPKEIGRPAEFPCLSIA